MQLQIHTLETVYSITIKKELEGEKIIEDFQKERLLVLKSQPEGKTVLLWHAVQKIVYKMEEGDEIKVEMVWGPAQSPI